MTCAEFAQTADLSPRRVVLNDPVFRVARPCRRVIAQKSCSPARLAQPEPRMRLAVRGVPKGALRTHSA